MEAERPNTGGYATRASDADRDAAVERLACAASDGRLTLDEYTDRSARALECRTLDDLGALTRDLPAPTGSAAPVAGEERLTAILGNESRKGRWTVPERLVARSVLGDCHIELQDALLTSAHTTIEASAVLGSITVYVPEGVDVRLTGRAVMSEKQCRMTGRPEPGAPVIEVHCDALLGSVVVRPPEWHMKAAAAARQIVDEFRPR